MSGSEIEIGKNYWVMPGEGLLARKALVLKSANTEPRWFQCIADDGEGYVVFSDAFIRPVEPEPVAS